MKTSTLTLYLSGKYVFGFSCLEVDCAQNTFFQTFKKIFTRSKII